MPRTCHIVKHHVGGQENSDCATKYSLPSLGNLRWCLSRDEQLHKLILDKQYTLTSSPKYTCQSNLCHEGDEIFYLTLSPFRVQLH